MSWDYCHFRVNGKLKQKNVEATRKIVEKVEDSAAKTVHKF